MRTKATIFAVSVACVAVSAIVLAAPAPKASPKTWQLDCAFHDPQRISVTLPGHKEESTFWYMLLTVTNNTGKDVQFFPEMSLVTNELELVTAGDNVHPLVYDAIAARHAKQYPFFAPPADVTGLLLQGADNARTTAAVFVPFSKKADSFVVYTSGLSGDIKRVFNPSFDSTKPESESNPRWFILRETLSIMYDIPGDESTRDSATPIRRHREWVKR